MSLEYDALVIVHPLYTEANSCNTVDMSAFDENPKPDIYSTEATRTFADPKYLSYKQNLIHLLEQSGDTPVIQYEEATKFEKTMFLRDSGLVDRIIPTHNQGYAAFSQEDEKYMGGIDSVLLVGQVKDICVRCAKEQLEQRGIKTIIDDKYVYKGWRNNPEVVRRLNAGEIR